MSNGSTKVNGLSPGYQPKLHYGPRFPLQIPTLNPNPLPTPEYPCIGPSTAHSQPPPTPSAPPLPRRSSFPRRPPLPLRPPAVHPPQLLRLGCATAPPPRDAPRPAPRPQAAPRRHLLPPHREAASLAGPPQRRIFLSS